MQTHNIETLPKWAQDYITTLRRDIQSIRALERMHAILEDKERDWFTLPDPINGCNEESMGLWVLYKDAPFKVCMLYKGDMLFIGRADKYRHGSRWPNAGLKSNYTQVLNPKSNQWVLIDTRQGVIVEHSDTKYEGVEVATKK